MKKRNTLHASILNSLDIIDYTASQTWNFSSECPRMKIWSRCRVPRTDRAEQFGLPGPYGELYYLFTCMTGYWTAGGIFLMTISKINSKLSFSGVSDLHCETHLSNIASSNSKSLLVSNQGWVDTDMDTKVYKPRKRWNEPESSDISDVSGDKFDINSSISASNIFVLKFDLFKTV